MRLTAWFAIFASFPVTALAHTTGCDGSTVPPEVQSSCCGKADAHVSDSAHVYEKEAGHWYYLVDGKEWPIVSNTPEQAADHWIEPLSITHDGCYWLWYAPTRMGNVVTAYSFYCLQIPSTI
jgi:hypothetical protein